MGTSRSKAQQWASEQFGCVELGDVRRTQRLVAMGAAACAHPSGKIAGVFTREADREGAYDFVENDAVDAKEIVEGIASVTARQSVGLPFVYVAVDGTSVTVTDRMGKKEMGSIGTRAQGARGVKAIDALAIDPEGVPVGLLWLTWWSRDKPVLLRGYARSVRPLEEKESNHWVETVGGASRALDERGVRGHFLIDREGDNQSLLLALEQTHHRWTVRSNRDRNIELEGGDVSKLRAELGAGSVSGQYRLQVSGGTRRTPREAVMVVRVKKVVLRLRDQKTDRITRLSVTAVWACEHGTTPASEEPLDWMLFTNQTVETLVDAQQIVWGYSQRWRVEEFHRTWKAGDCDIESSQLGSPEALMRWATIVAPVAVRIERLKRLARTKPNTPASVALSPYEIRALIVLIFDKELPDRQPTIAEAVSWLAELGGFTGKYSGRQPGATVLGRGLKHLRPAARVLELQSM